MKRLIIGIIAMAIVVVASNILVQFLIFDGLLTWGAFTYPLAFLVTDVMNRLYGPRQARQVVLAGFAIGVVCSLIGSQIMLDGGGYDYPAVAVRIAIASGLAFLTAQLLDVAIFDRMRGGQWWKAPVVSSLLSSCVDTAIFFFIAFSATVSFGQTADAQISWAQDTMPLLTFGAEYPLWVSLAVADWLVKLTVAVVALVPFRLIIGRMIQARTIA